MNVKRFAPLLVVVLLTLLAGSTAKAAPPTQGGPYDPRVAARFLGKWQWVKSPDLIFYPIPYIEFEDRGTYALMRMWICPTPAKECVTVQPIDVQVFTAGEKLVWLSEKYYYAPNGPWDQSTYEFVILPNGHLLKTITAYHSWRETTKRNYEYSKVSGSLPAVPTRAPVQPTVVPVQPVVPGAGQKGGFCGPDTATEPSLIDRLIGVYAADFPSGQCTWFVAQKRTDIKDWLGDAPRPAYVWDDRARANGAKYGVVVRDRPHVGDIAVWERGCSGADSANGHVAYVSRVNSDGTFQVEEANWNRTNPNVTVQSCMSFISPEGTVQPKPSSLIERFWDWLKSLFGR